MKSPLPLIAIAVLLPLAACGHKTQTVQSYDDPQANAIANAAPVVLPPPVRASVSLRCKDNSLVFIDFFEGDTQANIRMKQTDSPTHLTAAKAGDPLTGSGYTVKGNEKSAEVTTPGKPAQTCKA